MTCKLNSLFSIGEDFDDEDLLGTDWAAPSASGPASSSAVVSSCSLSAASVAHRGKAQTSQPTGARSAALSNGSGPGRDTQTAAGQTVITPGLRQLSCHSSAQLRPLPAFSSTVNAAAVISSTVNTTHNSLVTKQSCSNAKGQQRAPEPQDDFDEWDVDLEDLDESDRSVGAEQTGEGRSGTAAVSVLSLAKVLRPSACGVAGPRVLGVGHQAPNAPPGAAIPLRSPLPSSSSSSRSPAVFPGLTSASPLSSPFPRAARGPRHPQGPWATPFPSPAPRARSLFDPVSPAPAHTPSPALTPRPLHAWPLLTNHLVQLVSASNRPAKRPRSEPARPKTRRFPGPAGLLPQQAEDQSLDDIVVSAPQTPAHGAVARLPSQSPSSQTEEEEFSGGPWAVMKADMGLDERHPSCFLHSYSVVMVLRKAALKQLAMNKVPNMAVMLKSILHTHTDAKAVFKDPTGEMQGTVHRRLLEDRLGELKPGAVLLLKQVGVFSPSHRNHYLNVTPNNLLRVYSPDGACMPSSQLPPLVLENLPPSLSADGAGESRMQLLFDDEDEEEEEEGASRGGPGVSADSGATPPGALQRPVPIPAPPTPAWDADDDLDELMGELLEDTL